MNIRFLPLARLELARAAIFYDRRKVGLGDRLLDRVGRALRDIRQFPHAHPPIDALHRRCILRVFPYSLVFRVEGDTVWIMAVAHMSRRPGYWRRRKIG